MILLVNCGKLPTEQHNAVHNAIDTHPHIGDWRHCLDSSWFIDTGKDFDIARFNDLIHEKTGKSRLFISPVYQGHTTGWIHKDSWDWIGAKHKVAPPAGADKHREPAADNEAAQGLREITAAPALEDFIGMDEAAAQLKRLVAGITFRAAARRAGMQLSSGFSNMLISGPSGVGKTSLAQCAAQMLKDALPGNAKKKIYLVQAADLIDRHVGKSANNTKAVLDAARDGIIVFDEIDTLLDISHYGAEVLNTLNSHIGNAPNKPVIIATLYASREQAFRNFNTGLSSRFPHVQKLSGYNDATLSAIFARKLEKAGLACAPGCDHEIARLIADLRRSGGSNFGNAREIDNIFHATIDNLAERFSELPDEIRQAFLTDDTLTDDIRALVGTITIADLPVRGGTGVLMRRPAAPTPPDEPGKGGNLRTLAPRP